MRAIAWRVVDAVIAILQSGPWTVLVGGFVLWTLARWLGWWSVVAIAVGVVADFVWCALQLPPRWRPW